MNLEVLIFILYKIKQIKKIYISFFLYFGNNKLNNKKRVFWEKKYKESCEGLKNETILNISMTILNFYQIKKYISN